MEKLEGKGTAHDQYYRIIFTHDFRCRSLLALCGLGLPGSLRFAMVVIIVLAQFSAHASEDILDTVGSLNDGKISLWFEWSLCTNGTDLIVDEESKILDRARRAVSPTAAEGKHELNSISYAPLCDLPLVNWEKPTARTVS